MASSPLAQRQLEDFHTAIQSLKLYRRAELNEDDGASLIEDLYVDPLPNDHVLSTILKPNTTFIIGRKGTGKSTVFQRAQYELRKRPSFTSAYIDIKTLYESSLVDPAILNSTVSTDVMPRESLEKLLLHKAFLAAVIGGIKDELKRRVEGSLWERVKQSFTGSHAELFEGLDNLLEEADNEKFINVLGIKQQRVQSKTETSTQAGRDISAGVALGPSPDLHANAAIKTSDSASSGEQSDHAEILMLTFDIRGLISQLGQVLKAISDAI